MNPRVVTVTAAVLAAVAVSACAPVVDGRAVAGDVVRPSEELKSAQLPAAPAVLQQVWEDVTGQGIVRWDRAEPYPAVWGPIPAPGVSLFTADDGMCTLGPAVRAADGSTAGYLTAGHCNPARGDRMQYMNASPLQDLIPLAAMTDAEDDDRGVDSGGIWSVAPGTAMIAETWPIAGVLTAEGSETLELGDTTPVCYAGARTGIHCGPLQSTNDDGRLVFAPAAPSLEGNSGAPVFMVSGGAAVLLGVLEGADEVSVQATYLDPALQRLQARAVVDATASAAVAGLPGYSDRVIAV